MHFPSSTLTSSVIGKFCNRFPQRRNMLLKGGLLGRRHYTQVGGVTADPIVVPSTLWAINSRPKEAAPARVADDAAAVLKKATCVLSDLLLFFPEQFCISAAVAFSSLPPSSPPSSWVTKFLETQL